MSIEERLREIFEYKTDVSENYDLYEITNIDEITGQIIQAFKNDGWVKVISHYDRAVFNSLGHDREKLMTGQEWFDRFEGELKKNAPRRLTDSGMELLSTVLKSARGASGIEGKK